MLSKSWMKRNSWQHKNTKEGIRGKVIRGEDRGLQARQECSGTPAELAQGQTSHSCLPPHQAQMLWMKSQLENMSKNISLRLQPLQRAQGLCSPFPLAHFGQVPATEDVFLQPK